MNLHNEARGFRNNNPGNIRHGEKWYGLAEKQTDPDFCQFVSVEYGIRAMFKTLETYREKYGLKTVREIITRWAPPSENDTADYLEGILKRTGLAESFLDEDMTDKWSSKNTLGTKRVKLFLVYQIIWHENGIFPFDEHFLRKCEHFGE